MANIQLDDLVYTYPDQSTEGFQTLITAKKEFRELVSSVTETINGAGQLYRHQKLIRRFMLVYDRILLIHRTGTGKSCAAFGTSEQFKIGMLNAMIDFIEIYLKPQRTNIKRIYVLTKGPTLINELKNQLACRCTNREYITELVLQAKNEKTRKSNLTREIKKFYTITTYGKFANQIAERNYTDEQIKEIYSGSMFIVDEAQNLHVDPTGGEEEQQRRIYDQLWRVFHVVERSKVMLLTATPMINEVNEIAPIMNLILPLNQQLPLDGNYAAVTLDQIEPYFRGKISFVRELDTGAVPDYQGNVINAVYDINGQQQPSQAVVYSTQMSSFQQQTYLQVSQSQTAFRQRERQAANFVFPDGSSGTEGFNKYVQQQGPDRYLVNEELRQNISDMASLVNLSSKFSAIINLCSSSPGNCFIYTDFLVGSGAALLGLCFEALGFEQFTESGSIFRNLGGQSLPDPCSSANPKGTRREVLIPVNPKRFALLTSETEGAKLTSLLEAFNSYENRHGDYIKVLIGSPVSKIGLNLANVVQIHLLGPAWNQSNAYQAISRAIRSTSHDMLIAEEREKIALEGGDINSAHIKVNIYQHAAITDSGTSVDLEMYQGSEIKDISIKRMERMMKQTAIDCQINYKRNVRPTDVNGSPICDYDICQYQCYDPAPDYVDYSSYDVLYADSIVDDAINNIKSIFTSRFNITFKDLYQLLNEYKPSYIDRAVEKLIFQKIALIDRFGNQSYLREDNGIIFLKRDYPVDTTLTSQDSYSLSIYSENLIAIQDIRLSNYVATLQLNDQISTIEQLRNVDPTTSEFTQIIDQLNLESHVNLLENAIYDYIINQNHSAYNSSIINYFSNYIFELNEPISEIQASADRLANRGKSRGRKPNPNSKTRVQKINPVEPQPTPELEQTTEIVYIHILYNQSVDRVSYAVTAKFTKADGRLRLLKPSEHTGWRDTNPYEFPVYNSYIQRTIQSRLSDIEQNPIYGIIFSNDGKFRIRDKTSENPTQIAKDARKQNRGRICSTWSKPDLINVIYKLNPQLLPNNITNMSAIKSTVSSYTDEQLIEYLKRSGVTGVTTENFDRQKLEFFYIWYYSQLNREHTCGQIRSYLEANGLLLII